MLSSQPQEYAFTVENHADREVWLANRSSSIGASEAPVLWGLSKYDSYYSLWQRKCGFGTPKIEDDPEWIAIGNELEAPIARLAQRKTKRELEDWGRTTVLRSRMWPWLTCTLDYVQVNVPGRRGPGPLDCKNRGGGWAAADWEDGIPLDIWAQLQQQCIVTDFSWASAAVLLNGNEIRVIDCERDDEWCEMHVEKSKAFWRLVQAKTPPVPDGGEHTTAALKRWVPPDGLIKLPDEAATVVDQILALKSAELAAKKTYETAKESRQAEENKMRVAFALAGGNAGQLGDGRVLSLQLIEKAGHVVAPSSYTKLTVKTIKPLKAAKEKK